MKRKVPFVTSSSLVLLLTSLFLFSCVGMKKFQEDTYASRDKDKQSFVQTTDGKVLEANEAVLRSPLFGKSTIQLDGETKIPVKEVEAYQDKAAYYKRINGQFAPRFKKGLINMYRGTESYTEFESPSSFNGGRSTMRTKNRAVYYIQKGADGAVNRFDPQLVKEYVQDYAPAMEYINVYEQTQKKARMWSWINTTAVLGGIFLATQGIDNNNQVTPVGYASVGLFFGGFINGFVNKVRKGRNGKNLELAIDAYNYQTVKKKR
jgi:hypothetical protein